MIDPSIALDVKPYQAPDFNTSLNMAKTIQGIQASQQQIEQSKAETANAQAQLPGYQAQSQTAQVAAGTAQRQQQGQQITQQIMTKNMKTNPDGTQTLDAVGAANDFAAAGLPDQAHTMLKPYLDSLTGNADLVKKLQDNEGDRNTLQLKVLGPMLYTAAGFKDPEQSKQFLQRSYAGAEKEYPDLFPPGKTPMVDALVARAMVDPVQAAGFATTPKEWIQQGLDKQNADTAAKNAQTAAYSAATQDVVQRLGAAAGINDATSKSTALDAGVQAIEQVKTMEGLPASMLGLKGAQLKALVETDPRFAAIRNTIEYGQKNGVPVNYDDGLAGIENTLNTFSNISKTQAQRLAGTQNNANRPVGGAPPTAPGEATPNPAPPAATGLNPAMHAAGQTSNRLTGQEYGPTKIKEYASKHGMTAAQVKAQVIQNGGTVTDTDY